MSIPMFSRIVVLDVVYDPMAINKERLDYWKYEFQLNEPFNLLDISVLPRNTILGKCILDSNNNDTENASLFFPFFPPHLSLPCKPGEHMWAIYNESPMVGKQGYWFCRVSDLWHVDDLNHTHPPRAGDPCFKDSLADKQNRRLYFEFNNGKLDRNRNLIGASEYVSGGPDFYSNLINQDQNQLNASRLTPAAPVPRYRKRPGDLCFEGSNNTLIVMGTDRNGSVADYQTIDYVTSKETIPVNSPYIPLNDTLYGSIDLVAGRGQSILTGGETAYASVYPEVTGFPSKNKFPRPELNKDPITAIKYPNEGDPDLITDVSRIRISEKNRVDTTLEIADFNLANFSISDSNGGDGSIIIKTDKLRLIARKDVEILVATDYASTGSYAAVVIKANGDIVFRPSDQGYLKLGGNDADKAILCTDLPAVATEGNVTASPLFTTGSDVVGTGKSNQGTFAKKILVK